MELKHVIIGGLGLLLFLNRRTAKSTAMDLYYGEDMQLTSHFTWREFQGSSGVTYETAKQRTLDGVHLMATTLEVIRGATGGLPIVINSGIRTPASSALIADKGGNPSNTSDHFYGENPASPLSVGAVDIVCPKMDTKEFFNLILKLKYQKAIRTGQLLLEHNNSYWVHLANDPRQILTSAELAKRSNSSINLVAYSMNNGQSFTPIPDGGFLV
jgi:hypothetical protein